MPTEESGFYPKTDREKAEEKAIRSAGNKIGFSCLFYVFAASLIGELLSFLLYKLFPIFELYLTSSYYEVTDLLFSAVCYILSLLLPFGLCLILTRMPLRVAFPFKTGHPTEKLCGVFVGLGTAIVAGHITAAFSAVLMIFGIGIEEPASFSPVTLWGKVIYVLIFAILPAFLEEMIFRGIILQNLRRFGDKEALFLSALFFAVFHLNLSQIPYAFLMGLCLGYFVLRTGSLWVGILLHLCNNALSLLWEFMDPLLSDRAFYLISTCYDAALLLFAFVALLVLIRKVPDSFVLKETELSLSAEKHLRVFLLSPGVLLALLAAAVAIGQSLILLR